MAVKSAKGRDDYAIVQFSIFLENKVGRLDEVLQLFAKKGLHIMAICTLDTTDSAITRVIVDYPEDARELLVKDNFPFSEITVIAVEIVTEADFLRISHTLSSAEINVNYTYSFMKRPEGRIGLVLHTEDNDMGIDVLSSKGIRVLDRFDIAR
jgi:hypothetical protein